MRHQAGVGGRQAHPACINLPPSEGHAHAVQAARSVSFAHVALVQHSVAVAKAQAVQLPGEAAHVGSVQHLAGLALCCTRNCQFRAGRGRRTGREKGGTRRGNGGERGAGKTRQ